MHCSSLSVIIEKLERRSASSQFGSDVGTFNLETCHLLINLIPILWQRWAVYDQLKSCRSSAASSSRKCLLLALRSFVSSLQWLLSLTDSLLYINVSAVVQHAVATGGSTWPKFGIIRAAFKILEQHLVDGLQLSDLKPAGKHFPSPFCLCHVGLLARIMRALLKT